MSGRGCYSSREQSGCRSRQISPRPTVSSTTLFYCSCAWRILSAGSLLCICNSNSSRVSYTVPLPPPSPSRLMGITLPQIDDGSTNTLLTPSPSLFPRRTARSIYYFLLATDRREFYNGNSVFPSSRREVFLFGKFSVL